MKRAHQQVVNVMTDKFNMYILKFSVNYQMFLSVLMKQHKSTLLG